MARRRRLEAIAEVLRPENPHEAVLRRLGIRRAIVTINRTVARIVEESETLVELRQELDQYLQGCCVRSARATNGLESFQVTAWEGPAGHASLVALKFRKIAAFINLDVRMEETA